MTTQSMKFIIAVALSAALATPALAQGMCGQGMGGQGTMHGGQAMMGGQRIPGGQAMMHGGQGMMGGSADGMLDRIEGRLAFLRTELKITDSQMPQWNKLTEAVRASGKNLNERMQARMSGQEQAATLPERLERREQLMTARLEEVRQVKGALNELYSSLTEEQKKEANTLVLPMIGMDGMGMSPGR